MGMPHVTTFCWCMDLGMGATFVGYMHLVISVTLIVLTSLFAESIHSYVNTVEDMDGVYLQWYVISVVVALVTVAHLMLAATLLYGVYKSRPVCVRVWVIAMCSLCVCALLYACGAAIAALAQKPDDLFLPLAEGVLFFGLLSYSIIGVNSYYLYLKNLEGEDIPQTI